ncbi:uncharacterized protein VTP21DRAFT_1103 [Calcarisporiella thermophila]|uniref:uncharacterized protein n=1 Tax=Calcarisporiella thermophila TaxID=911321 RepID=UPI003742C816
MYSLLIFLSCSDLAAAATLQLGMDDTPGRWLCVLGGVGLLLAITRIVRFNRVTYVYNTGHYGGPVTRLISALSDLGGGFFFGRTLEPTRMYHIDNALPPPTGERWVDEGIIMMIYSAVVLLVVMIISILNQELICIALQSILGIGLIAAGNFIPRRPSKAVGWHITVRPKSPPGAPLPSRLKTNEVFNLGLATQFYLGRPKAEWSQAYCMVLAFLLLISPLVFLSGWTGAILPLGIAELLTRRESRLPGPWQIHSSLITHYVHDCMLAVQQCPLSPGAIRTRRLWLRWLKKGFPWHTPQDGPFMLMPCPGALTDRACVRAFVLDPGVVGDSIWCHSPCLWRFYQAHHIGAFQANLAENLAWKSPADLEMDTPQSEGDMLAWLEDLISALRLECHEEKYTFMGADKLTVQKVVSETNQLFNSIGLDCRLVISTELRGAQLYRRSSNQRLSIERTSVEGHPRAILEGTHAKTRFALVWVSE